MATDQSPPRIQIIIRVAVITVATLVGLKFVFDSYFVQMTEEAAHDKLAKPVELLKLREGEQKNLTSAAVPIKEAMAQVAGGKRDESIAPQPSEDTGALSGWAKLPKAVATCVQSAAPAADAGVAAAAPGDAGAAAAIAPHAAPPAASGPEHH